MFQLRHDDDIFYSTPNALKPFFFFVTAKLLSDLSVREVLRDLNDSWIDLPCVNVALRGMRHFSPKWDSRLPLLYSTRLGPTLWLWGYSCCSRAAQMPLPEAFREGEMRSGAAWPQWGHTSLSLSLSLSHTHFSLHGCRVLCLVITNAHPILQWEPENPDPF